MQVLKAEGWKQFGYSSPTSSMIALYTLLLEQSCAVVCRDWKRKVERKKKQVSLKRRKKFRASQMRVHTKSLKLIFFSSSANKPSIVTSHSLPTASQLTFESLFSNNRYGISYTDSINWLPTKATLNAFNNYCFWHVGTKLNLISDTHSIWSQTHKKFFSSLILLNRHFN